MGTEANRYRAVQVLVNGYGPIRQAVAPAAFLDLPAAILDGHRVVFVYHPFGLDGNHLLQIAPPTLAESCAGDRWLHPELGVELLDVAVPQELIGMFHRCDSGLAKLLRQPPESFESPAPSAPDPPALNASCPPARRLSPYRRNGCPDRCIANRTLPAFLPPVSVPSSPSAWIPPPPVARNKSRWWRRPE